MTAALYTAEQRAEWEKLGLVLIPASPGSPYDILKPKEKQNGHITVRQRAAMAHLILSREGRVSRYVKTVKQQENNEMAKAKAADKAPAQAAEGSKGEEQQAAPAAAPAAAKPAAAKSDLEKAADTARSEAEAKAATKSKKKGKAVPDVLPDARKYLSDAAKKRLDKEDAARKKGGKGKDKKPEKQEKASRKKQSAQPAKKAGGGIGGVVCEMLLKGKETDDILKAVKEKFPKAKTSAASVAWYRSQLRGEGKLK